MVFVGRKVRAVEVGRMWAGFLRRAQDRLFDWLRSLRMTVLFLGRDKDNYGDSELRPE
jgi:hypothetical protein